MSKREQFYIISYDISQNRLRSKIAKELENHGTRVQYSVFECMLTEARFRNLYKRLLELCNEDEADSIRIYPVCEKCVKRIRVIGIQKKRIEEEAVIII